MLKIIKSAFFSAAVMLSSLTINGIAAAAVTDSSQRQVVIINTADNDSIEYNPDMAGNMGQQTTQTEGSVSVGAFTVTGGELDTDFSYADGVLTVLTEEPLTISNTGTSAVTDKIAVSKDVSADITLSGVNINVSSTGNACAFMIADDSTGDVTVTLSGTNTLKSGSKCAGLQKNGANGSLTIVGTGSLTATGGSSGAGIGGGYFGDVTGITISGGTVTANGGGDSAGIGGGNDGDAAGITISGGTVTAKGSTNGAGIGGGRYGNVTDITISGGIVTAKGGQWGAGIGGGYYGDVSNITISGGIVSASVALMGGDDIGGGSSGTASYITISGGTVTSTGYIGDSATNIIISGGSVKASGIQSAPTNGVKNVYPMVIDNPDGGEILIDGVPFTPASHGDEAKVYAYLTGESHTVTVSGTSTDYYFNTPEELFYEGTSMDNYLDFTITGGTYGIDYIYCSDVITVLTDTPLTFSNKSEEATTQGIAVAKDVSANITLSGVNINASLCAFRIADDSTGDVNITLEGRNILKSNTGNAGLQKNGEYGSLTIGGTGSLTAKGGLSGAGIGSYGSSASNITIIGGTVTAIGNSGAGIGGGYNGSASNITISGGTVTATGVSGAGIGGGIGASASDITISGGTVKASSISITPTNGTEKVYVMVIENPTGRAILIDGTPFTPVVHGSEARAYAYVTGESHTITVNSTPANYCFNPMDNQFYKGDTIEDCIDFTITGGTYGEDYGFANGVVTIFSENPLTISNKTSAVTEQKLAVAKDISANITISGVNIDVSSESGACAFGIADNSTGNVNITLEGTNILKSGDNCAGLQKNGTNGSLTIGGTGALTAEGGPANYNSAGGAGIGSGAGYNTSNITINSGEITANGGGYGGAGIGGGSDGNASDITINGGTVTAASRSNSEGIGGGMHGSAAGITISGGTVAVTGSIGSSAANVTISSGTVNATGSIGSSASKVTINSGIVTVSGGIGSSAANVKIIDGEVNAGSIGSGATNITISGGTVTSSIIGGSNSNIIISGGSVKASVAATPTNGVDYVYSLAIGNPDGGEILIDGKPFTPVSHGSEAKVYAYVTGENHTVTVNGISENYCFHYLDKWFYKGNSVEEYLDFTITGGTYGVDYDVEYGALIIYTDKPLTISNKTDAQTNQGIAIAKDVSADITLSGVNIGTSGCAFLIADDSAGNVNITLLGTNTLYSGSGFAGLQKSGTNGSLTIGGTGSLNAFGGSGGAGIGGGSTGGAQNITISGGIVIAAGSSGGAGIGGGDNGKAAEIKISGGTVTANGGSGGAGIGSGRYQNASDIIISGGSVKAVGNNANDIGGGQDKSAVIPTNGSANVYLLVVENPKKETILIDGKEFTPIIHNDENRIYAYLTAEEHTVQTGRSNTSFIFVDGDFEEVEKEPIPAKVAGHGLTPGNLGVEFYISPGNSITADEKNNVLFTLPNGKTQRVYVKDSDTIIIENEECFVCPCYIAAAEISDVITVQIFSGENEAGDSFTYSLAEQCVYIVNNPDEYAAEVPLAKAILNYGTQAQLFFEHNTENPANACLDENDRTLEAISALKLTAYGYSVVDNDDDIDFIGQVVQLNDNVTVKFYFSGNIDASDCLINENRISSEDIGNDKNGSYIAIRNIRPEDYDKSYTIAAGDVIVSNASVFSYLYTALHAQRTDLYDIAYALYAYNKAAEIYFS